MRRRERWENNPEYEHVNEHDADERQDKAVECHVLVIRSRLGLVYE